MSNPLNALLRPPPPEGADFRLGYVTDTDPFEVTLDTETSPIPTPSTLVAVELGDRVFVLLESRHATVLGKVPEAPTTTTTTTVAPTARLQAGQASLTLYQNQTTNISFSPAFPSAPRVLVTFVTDPEGSTVIANVESVTTSGATIRLQCPQNWGGAFAFNWLAVPNGALML